MALRVFGVDPGLTRCGIGIVEVDARRQATSLHYGVIRSNPADALATRLHEIGTTLAALLDEWRPDVVALERVFAQHNVRTVMTVAQVSGIVSYLAAERDLAVATHTPSEVKAAVTGYGDADKKQVQAMVQRVLKLETIPKPADAADALALALCHAWRRPVSSAAREHSSARSALTPAQQAWRAAEEAARPRRPT